MQALSMKIFEKTHLIHSKRREAQLIQAEINSLETQIAAKERMQESELDSERQSYKNALKAEISDKYSEDITELQSQVEQLKNAASQQDVEEDEELAEAREKMEYLNYAAIQIDSLYTKLCRTATPYFVELAYNEKFLSMSAFKKEFEKIPQTLDDLDAWENRIMQPYSLVRKLSQSKNSNNFGTYMSSTVGSLLVVVTTPMAILSSIKKAHVLHNTSRKYHSLMHSLIKLKMSTYAEVQSIFKNLLSLRGERIAKLLEETESLLATAITNRDNELANIQFDEEKFKAQYRRDIAMLKAELEKQQQLLEELQNVIAELEEEERELKAERDEMIIRERDSYLKGRVERDVVLPTHLLYDQQVDTLTKVELKAGLYLYQDLQVVQNYIKLVVFQLRNIMDWGALQVRVLDVRTADFLAPMLLKTDTKTKTQDIFRYSLSPERATAIDLLHDLLIRRQTQVLSLADNIGDYNLLQKNGGSAFLPYQLVIIMSYQKVETPEKLVQLLAVGEKLGIMILVFVEEETINLNVAKSLAPYFSNVVELGVRGVSSNSFEDYVQLLINKESDKKARIR